MFDQGVPDEEDAKRRKEDTVTIVRGLAIVLFLVLGTWVAVVAVSWHVAHAVAAALS